MSFFLDALSTAGVTTALIGGATFLTKGLVQNQLSKDVEARKRDLQRELQRDIEAYKRDLQNDIESHKAALLLENSRALDEAKFEFEKELIVRRGEVDIFKEGYKFTAESQKQRAERLRAQVQRWALPIQGAISDLLHRLDDILTNQGEVMLSTSHPPVPGWSANYDYYMPSTLYYFAQYFCWTRLLQQQLGHELFDSPDEMTGFFEIMGRTADAISHFPFYEDEDGARAAWLDRQVFKLQQRAIGELLVPGSATGDSIVSYREFLDRWVKKSEDLVFARHIEPLELFLQDLSPGNDVRWPRLKVLEECLREFEEACQQILAPNGDRSS